MALPSSGPIKLSNIQTEFGGTDPVGLNEYYRGGVNVPDTRNTATIPVAERISTNNFYGAIRRLNIPLNITSPTYNYEVYDEAVSGTGYVAGISDVTVTVDPGVIVGSTATNTYAMLVSSAFNPSDTVTIVNNGVIQGRGGNGGAGKLGSATGGTGGVGGNALYVNRPVTIENYGSIAGGGGGGGGASGATPDKGPTYSGGGGGGGAGYNGGTGGGGPRPGSPGTSTAGGAGGTGTSSGLNGGPGGGRGANGAKGAATGGANPAPGGPGGAAGYYITGNPFVTWEAAGIRQGSVS